MKKSILIVLSLFLVLLVFLLLFNLDFIRQITGNQIFSDEDFEISIESFKPNNPTEGIISLSPEDCELTSTFPSNLSVVIDENISIIVNGQGCNGREGVLKIFEKDYFFDDGVAPVFDKFIGNFLEINACSEKPAMIQVKSIDTTGENLKLLESIRDLPPTNKHARTYNLKTFKDYNIYIVEMTDINLTN